MKPTLVFIAGMLFGMMTASLFFLITRSEPAIEQLAQVAPTLMMFQDRGFTAAGPSMQDRPMFDPLAPALEIPPQELTDLVEPPPRPDLLVPVQGIKASQLFDSFTARRDGGRNHNAIDIMAPEGTPVLAVDDGRVVRLFESDAGGLTIYQFDPDEKRIYYYAHLDDYAPGIREGRQVKRGEVIGYVGSTGNADSDAPHLHFAISEPGPGKRWWQGSAINPYPLFVGE